MLPMLVVDKDDAVIARESSAWEKHGVSTVRAASMQEAIIMLNKEDYLFVGINADNIDYLPQLRIMRAVTSSPIFIIGSTFSTEKEVEAIKHGADSYDPWRESTEDNIRSALAVLHNYTERSSARENTLNILHHGDIMMVLDYHKVFFNETELILTKAEFDILHYLILNRGRVLTYAQILNNVYQYYYDEDPAGILFSAMKRLRKKIRDVADADAFIENVRGVGYRLVL